MIVGKGPILSLALAALGTALVVHAADVTTLAVGRGPFDCKNIKVDSYSFHADTLNSSDLSAINFPVTVEKTEKTPPTVTKTSIKINLCAPLVPDAGPSDEDCPKGTRICMRVVNEKKGESDRVVQVIPAGGSADDQTDWSTQLGEQFGSERALEVEMHGGYYAERRQQTEIDFRCDKSVPKDNLPVMKKYDATDGKLKLTWSTPHACATHTDGAGGGSDSGKDRNNDGSPSKSESGGWGLFTWFFFFVFVGGIVYLAAGLWRNYNEYGVIELPNKDFWREAPYIAKDMGRHIYSTVSGQSTSRGAYEPV